jgi:hypothetical protein
VKYLQLLIYFIILIGNSYAQEPMIFFAEPDEIKLFLSKPYKKIDVKTMSSVNNTKDTTFEKRKMIYFYGDTICQIINIYKDQIADTTVYKYDLCGKLIVKKGKNINNSYKNFYKDCVLQNRESNEFEISFGNLVAGNNYIKYKYNKKGELQSELIYDTNDTFNILRSTEFSYFNNHIDSVNEFYFVDGEKYRNRASKYFYKNHLDSIHYYNFGLELIDKMVYQYNTKGRPETISSNSSKDYKYIYNDKKDPEKVIAGQGMREFQITYWE